MLSLGCVCYNHSISSGVRYVPIDPVSHKGNCRNLQVNGHEYITSCLSYFRNNNVLLEGRDKKSNVMADNTISPSLKSHFLNLYGMMIADMEVSPLEKAEIYRIGREEFGLTVEELDKLIISNEILFYLPEKEKMPPQKEN